MGQLLRGVEAVCPVLGEKALCKIQSLLSLSQLMADSSELILYGVEASGNLGIRAHTAGSCLDRGNLDRAPGDDGDDRNENSDRARVHEASIR